MADKKKQPAKRSPAKKAPAKPSAAKKAPAKKPGKYAKKSAALRAKRPWYKRRSFWGKFFSIGFTLFVIGMIALLWIAKDLPDISKLNVIDKRPGITIKTVDGLILATYGDVYGDYISYEEIPPQLMDAVLSTEDRRFFDHWGIDPFGIARAMVRNVQAGRFVQGGSTITQQVAKNVFLTPERTLSRKVQEALLALWLEGRFTKEEILAIYLNRVYLGAGVYGVDAASKRYFGKGARELTLMESAVLAGLLKAPSRYAPTSSLERSKNRAHQVLLNMVDAGTLAQDQVQPALDSFKAPPSYREDGSNSGTRYFTDWIAERVNDYTGDLVEDIEVITTLDPNLQRMAEDAAIKIMDEFAEEKEASQAAILTMAPGGAIRAMVGGRDYRESEYNRVTQAKRQPGSVFKLFVYLAALEAGAKPDSKVVDQPVELEVNGKPWLPRNFDGEYRGEIELQEALKHSINTVAVQLGQTVGYSKVAEIAKRFGIIDIPSHPSMVLGAVEVTLLEMTNAYAHMANRGRRVEPYGVLKITTKSGEEIYKRQRSGLWVVVSDHITKMMNHMLVGVTQGGTGGRANIGREVAGKTGTSQDYRDAWFIGFVPQYVTGVWVGNDNNTSMDKVTGGNLPAMIWAEYMRGALEGKSAQSISREMTAEKENLPWQNSGAGGFLKRLFHVDDSIAVYDEETESPQTNRPRQPTSYPRSDKRIRWEEQ